MAGVEGTDAGLEFLAVAAGMHDFANVVVPEDGQLRDRVADLVIGLPQSFGSQRVVRHRSESKLSNIGDLAHPGEAHVGSPGNHAGGGGRGIRPSYDMGPEHMGEGLGETAVAICEAQDAINVSLS